MASTETEPGRFRFDRFLLDRGNRQLRRDGVALPLNARYLDALALMVAEHGRLVTKERFLEDVWRGVPVTDEALTQCIRTLRRQLGDDAGKPRFIETVPKHGYRFIAPVEAVDEEAAGPAEGVREAPAPEEAGTAERAEAPQATRRVLLVGGAGMLGGGAAGALGGVLYGLAGAAEGPEPGVGAISVLLVLVCLTTAVGLVGGAGVGFGVAAAGSASGRPGLWSIAGGALGGLLVGALVKLLGLDTFSVLFGQSPGDITGAPEGALLGGAVGLGAWLGSRGRDAPRLRQGIAAAGLAGAAAGALITLTGGRLMAGSLDLVARRFPDSRLRLDGVGALLGESGLGPVSHVVTGALEGLLFSASVVGAMILARRSLESGGRQPLL